VDQIGHNVESLPDVECPLLRLLEDDLWSLSGYGGYGGHGCTREPLVVLERHLEGVGAKLSHGQGRNGDLIHSVLLATDEGQLGLDGRIFGGDVAQRPFDVG
jgi:hypothetical protein